jgi:hypothetical protein
VVLENNYDEINYILNDYNVILDKDDLKDIFLDNIFANKDKLRRYAWYKIIDMVLAIYSKEYFGKDLTNDDLNKMKLDYCTNEYFESQ